MMFFICRSKCTRKLPKRIIVLVSEMIASSGVDHWLALTCCVPTLEVHRRPSEGQVGNDDIRVLDFREDTVIDVFVVLSILSIGQL
jgi:hypothetical protein